MNIQSGEILETVKMMADQNFDVRTITIGIDLHDCVSSDINVLNQDIYNKITTVSKDLVATTKYLSAKYDAPIVNQHISVTPTAQIITATHADFYISMAQTLDKAVKAVGASLIGGFSAPVQKSVSPSGEVLIRFIPKAVKATDIVRSSVNIGSTRAGINVDAVKLTGETIKRTIEITPESFDCAKIIMSYNAVKGNPFMAGVFHGSDEAGAIINVGVSGPGIAEVALENSDVTTLTEVAEVVKKTAFKITRVDELIGREASKMSNTPFGILDLSLTSTPTVGDSVARILERMGLSVCGTHGITAALTSLSDAVKKGGMTASNAVGSLSGVSIPVSKDEGMITAVEAGMLALDKLEVITVVCSVGLGMIVVPGDTPTHTVSDITVDEAAIDTINSKTTVVHIIPVAGKTVGDNIEFGSLLGYASVMPVREGPCKVFVN